MADKKRIAAQFLDNVERHNLKFLIKINLSNSEVSKHFEFNTEID